MLESIERLLQLVSSARPAGGQPVPVTGMTTRDAIRAYKGVYLSIIKNVRSKAIAESLNREGIMRSACTACKTEIMDNFTCVSVYNKKMFYSAFIALVANEFGAYFAGSDPRRDAPDYYGGIMQGYTNMIGSFEDIVSLF